MCVVCIEPQRAAEPEHPLPAVWLKIATLQSDNFTLALCASGFLTSCQLKRSSGCSSGESNPCLGVLANLLRVFAPCQLETPESFELAFSACHLPVNAPTLIFLDADEALIVLRGKWTFTPVVLDVDVASVPAEHHDDGRYGIELIDRALRDLQAAG
ncbi:hypothetical protein TKK_0008698 [Trichogramma kaykai]